MGGIFFLLLCLFALNFAFFLVIWRREYRGVIVVTPFLIFAVSEMVFTWAASLLGVLDDLSDGYAALVVALSFLCFLLGYAVFRRDQVLPGRYAAKPIERLILCSAYGRGLTALCVLLLFISLFHYGGAPPISRAVGELLSGTYDWQESTSFMRQSREDLTKSHWFGGRYRGQGLTATLLRCGWCYALCLSVLVWLKVRRWSWLAASIIFTCLAFVFVAGDGTRAPILWLLVTLVVAGSLSFGLRAAAVPLYLGIMVGVLLAVTFLSSKAAPLLTSDNVVTDALGSFSHRLFLGNGYNTVRAIELVHNDEIAMRLGEVHLQKAISALPGIQYGTPFSHQLYLAMDPWARGTTFATGTYLSTLYVDFGFVGSLFGYFLVGLLFGRCNRVLFKSRKTMREITFISLAIVYLAHMILPGGPVAFLSSFVVLWAIDFFFRNAARFGTRPRFS